MGPEEAETVRDLVGPEVAETVQDRVVPEVASAGVLAAGIARAVVMGLQRHRIRHNHRLHQPLRRDRRRRAAVGQPIRAIPSLTNPEV